MDPHVDSTSGDNLLDLDDDFQQDGSNPITDERHADDSPFGKSDSPAFEVLDAETNDPAPFDNDADNELVSSSLTAGVSHNLVEFEAGDTPIVRVTDHQYCMEPNADISSSNSADEKLESDIPETSEATPTPSAPQTPVVEAPKHEPKPVSTDRSSDDQPVKLPKQATSTVPVMAKGCNSCSYTSYVSPWVMNLLLWRNPVLTGSVLGLELVLLLSLTCCSVFSVVSYSLLLALIGVFGARLVKYVLGAVHSGDDSHPFKLWLDLDFSITDQQATEYGVNVAQELNCCVKTIRDLVLVKEVIPSLKFGLVLYALTYLGACFNGLTLFILAVVGAFTIPKVYTVNKVQIDRQINAAQTKFDDVYRQLQDKVPFLKKQKTQ